MILVFDVGGTQTRIGLAENGELGDVVTTATDTSAAGFARLLGALQEVSKGFKIRGVVGGMPGQLEGEDGNLTLAHNLPNWLGLPVRARMQRLFDCRVNLLNDVELCGLGEAQYGSGIKKGVMAYFTISTGVNAVRIVDGHIDNSISRYEIGRLIVDTKNGVDESLESLTGGAALALRKGRLPKNIHDTRVWKQEEHDLARGLYDVLIAWTPELVVFGGSMMRDIDLKAVQTELEGLPNVLSSLPRLDYAKLGNLAGLRGAIAWMDQTKR
jgi:predicted NBD/HSP70 family sugar kinase